jgi:peptidoglycan/xylan/chitin deacetylase (PgdA/CDA1 family)
MRLFRPGIFSGLLFPEAVFRISTGEKSLCLTFDDGPDPDSTFKILKILDKHKVRAIFFCNGKAAEQYPDIISAIKSAGHIVGNHGYEHLNGWKCTTEKYLENAEAAVPFTSDFLFRPPYGKLSLGQYFKLKEYFKIMFWDIMPYDFDESFGAENSLRILKKKIRNGSVIVLHDTPRSCAGSLLSEFIIHSLSEGYKFILPE